jgi:hypothetical protein
MNVLRAKQFTPEMLLHYPAMLKNILTIDGEASIPTSIEAADAPARIPAGEAAKSGVLLNAERGNMKRTTALNTL